MYKALWKNDVLFDDTGEALAHVRHDRVVLAHSQIQVSIERRFPTGIVYAGSRRLAKDTCLQTQD